MDSKIPHHVGLDASAVLFPTSTNVMIGKQKMWSNSREENWAAIWKLRKLHIKTWCLYVYVETYMYICVRVYKFSKPHEQGNSPYCFSSPYRGKLTSEEECICMYVAYANTGQPCVCTIFMSQLRKVKHGENRHMESLNNFIRVKEN